MIEVQVSPLVLNVLSEQFPHPANSAKRALDKYVSLLTEQLNSCELRGRSAWHLSRDLFYISLSKQRHKGGQIGSEKTRLQNWLEENKLELFDVVEKGSNLSQQETVIRLSSLVSLKRTEAIRESLDDKTELEIIALLNDEATTNKQLFERLYPDIEHLEVDEMKVLYEFVPVDQRSLKNYMRWLKDEASLMTARERLKLINQAELIFRVSQHSDGFFPQRKKPSAFGRMYYEGISVQSVNKQLREAMLGHAWEYDIKSAVFTWKMSYAQQAYELLATDKPLKQVFQSTITLLEDKSDFLRYVRFRTFESDSNVPRDFQEKLIKQAITAIGFGARVTATGWKEDGEWKNSSIGTIIKNPLERKRFVNCDLIREFIREQSMLDAVIYQAGKNDDMREYEGADVRTKSGRLSKAKIIAFMYQTYETDLMNVIEALIHKLGKQVIARVHDAIITKQKLSVDDREEILFKIRQATDNPYWKLSHKELQPFIHDSLDPIPSDALSFKNIVGMFTKALKAA
jgi:hypothetical protein